MSASIVYAPVVSAVFLCRLNRFTAKVLLDEQEEMIHVMNTGRLGELLLPGTKVMLHAARNPSRKTRWDLISVHTDSLGWVNLDSLAPNHLMRDFYASGGYDIVRPEYTYGASRLDFYLEKNGRPCMTEVKGCTLAMAERPGIGLFPDAPTERGVRHLHELGEAAAEGYEATLAFVLQMNGIHTVLPNRLTQPAFAQALTAAVHSGVRVQCFSCDVNADRITLKDGQDTTDLYL